VSNPNNSLSSGSLIGKLRGILLPLTTPYSSDGELALDHLSFNLKKWRESGLSGYVMMGSTGERVHLEEREYVELVKHAREQVPNGPDGLAFIVGAGQQSTRGTIKEVARAAAAGADAVLVITPNFYKSAITQEALVSHYTAVADSSSVPVMLYSMPDLTGIKIQPETIARLSSHANIIGVKDSSNDIAGLAATVSLVRESTSPDDFAILSGNGTVLLDALRAGADGAILAVGCAAPQLCLEVFHAWKSGADERAATLQEKLTPLARAVTTRFGIGGLKSAMEMMGFYGGPVRAPLRSPGEAARSEIKQLLQEAHAILSEREVALESAELSAL